MVPWKEYVASVSTELVIRGAHSQLRQLNTVYCGGGTPSRLGIHGVAALFDVLREHAAWSDDAEITLEANPEDVTTEAVRAWRRAGVNRLSIGVQSFDERVLSWMHRVHDADVARRAVAIARDEGLSAFSLDLIFGTPEQLQRDWSRDVAEMLDLEPDHVSLYGLTIEPHTPLGRWHERGEVAELPEERYEAEFLLARERLTAAGYEHYEVSNFARPGKRARHNSAYWQGVSYLGIGPSAHGFDGAVRRWNIPALAAWEASLAQGRDPLGGSEILSVENAVAESVYLGLRTVDGLVLAPDEAPHITPWLGAGWVEWCSRDAEQVPELRIRCTAAGWLRLDALAADLTAFRSRP